MSNLDEPQAATPLRRPSDKSVVKGLETAQSNPSQPVEKSEAQLENEKTAGEELALIFELSDSRAFQWFKTNCLDEKYREAEGLLKNEHAKQTIEVIRARYFAVKDIYVWLIEREIAHRETTNPQDAEILRLREKLATL